MFQLESCQNSGPDAMLEIVAQEFCTLPLTERIHKSYVLGITLLRYLDVYNFMYKVCPGLGAASLSPSLPGILLPFPAS